MPFDSFQHIPVEGLTKDQRSSMQMKGNIGRIRKAKEKAKQGRKIFVGSPKKKYFCPKKQEGYWASERHVHCKICYKQDKGIDYHEPILFDKKLGHTW